MTPEEFYKEFAGYNSDDELATQHIDPDFLFRAMQGYADHCEESAWVSVEDDLPEKTDEYRVLILDDSVQPNEYYTINAVFRSDKSKWFATLTGNKVYPEKWRSLPTEIPKNPGKKEK